MEFSLRKGYFFLIFLAGLTLFSNTAFGFIRYVTNTGNFGGGTLRTEILLSNFNPGPDTIYFNIPGTGPWVISPTGAIPAISDGNLVIDASTQPGYTPGSVILDGTNAPANLNGLWIEATAPNVEIYGLYIRDYTWTGFGITAGIRVEGDNATIGAAGKGNILCNNNYGIAVLADQSSGATIQGNTIGLEPDGITANGNDRSGILIEDGAGSAGGTFQIGGSRAAGEGNLIGSSGFAQISISARSIVQGNILGTDITETQNRSNGWNQISGFQIDAIPVYGDADGSLIGGSSPDLGNTIAYAGANAIQINSVNKVRILNNTIFEAGQLNRAFVAVDVLFADSILISRNSMYCNGEGINLFGTANNSKATPIIATATATLINGTAAPGDSIEVYAHDTTGCPWAGCQGKTFLGGTRANAAGLWTLTGAFAFGEATATATDVPGCRTSEFSPCVIFNTVLEERQQEPSPPLAHPEPQVYPNPSRGQVFFQLPSEQEGSTWSLQVFDLTGKRRYSHHYTVMPYQDPVQTDFSAFPPGRYWVKLSSGRELYSEMLILE